MTRQYEKVVQLSKKISKKGKVKTSTKHLKKNLPQPQEDEDETYNLEEPQETEEMQEIQENQEAQEIQEPPASPNNILLLSSTCYLVLLDEEDHLVVNANFNVKVLCGKASAFGCPLDVNSKLLEIKSKGKSLIPIKAVESGSVNQDLIPFIVTSLNTIRSSSVKPQTEQKIKEFFAQRWDSVVLAITTTQPLKIESIRVIREDTEDHSFNPILYPSGIQTDIARHILQHLSLNDMKKKILVVGDKNSGKSLLSVFLLNSMLSYLQENLPKSAVFYLESDLGQNSFFFPGTVGLFNFTEHVMSNLLQHRIYNPVVYEYVGEFSPQQFTSNYLKAIENCMKFYDFSSINCPLIINTHGYVANIGENILYDMIRIVKPDLVVLLDKHSDKISAVDHGYLEYNPIAKIEEEIRKRSFYEHKSIVGLPNETYRGPALWKLELPKFKEAVAHKKEKKDSAMLAYLLNSKSIDSKKTMNIPRISEICLAQPIELSFDEHLFSVLGNSSTIFFFREHFVKFSMMFISSIVSLNYSPYINTKELAYTQPFDFQNGLKNSSSKGFGYIRDINPEKRTILIVTPMTSQELSIVNVIVKSSQVQFSNDIYLEDSPLNIENWLNIPNYQDVSNATKVDKPFINDILYGVGSESYRNLKSLRKVQ